MPTHVDATRAPYWGGLIFGALCLLLWSGCGPGPEATPEEAAAARVAMLPGKVGPSGEVVMVVGPGEPVAIEAAEVGPTLKTIAAALSERWGCKKSEAYSALVALEEGRD